MSASSGSQSSQEAVLSAVRSAVVYADTGAADWINWCRLLPLLIEHGALAVREFHANEKLRPAAGVGGIRKAVFLLTGRIDSRVTMETLAELVTGAGLNCAIVLSGACSEAAICADVEESLGHWLGPGAVAQVRFVPLGHVTLMPGSNGGPDPEFVVLAGCPADQESRVRSLHSLLCELSAKEDVFCLGHASSRLGDALAAYAPAKERRRLANHRRAALLLVDRALDLIGPLSFLADSWLDSPSSSSQPPDDEEDDDDAMLLARLHEARSAQPRLRLCDCSVVPTYSPLIGQLAADVFAAAPSASAAAKAAAAASVGNSGLQYVHKSTGLSGLFGYLGVTSKPKPSDSDLILVCLVGGCTWSEYRLLRERIRQVGGSSGKRVCLVTDRLIRSREQLIGAVRRGELF